jgi:hypothetical protein
MTLDDLKTFITFHIFNWTPETADLRTIDNMASIIDRRLPELGGIIRDLKSIFPAERPLLYDYIVEHRKYINYLEWSITIWRAYGRLDKIAELQCIIKESRI